MSDHAFRYLIRRCGWPVRTVLDLDAVELERAEAKLANQDAQLTVAVERASTKLHGLVKGTSDADGRRALLDLRRDLHNRRKRASVSLQRAMPWLDSDSCAEAAAGSPTPDLCDEMSTLVERIETARSGEQDFAILFDGVVNEQRTHLRSLVNSDSFLRGLSLSSHSLLSETRSFIRRPSLQPRKKRDTRVDRGLLAYLTRASVKTSPRSPWTTVGTPYAAPDGRTSLREYVLNTSVVVLWVEALCKHDMAHILWPLRVNPSLTQAGDEFIWLRTSGGRETTRRCPATPGLRRIVALLDPLQPMQLDTLFQRLELDHTELDGFRERIRGLLTHGILEVTLPVDLQAPCAYLQVRDLLAAANMADEAQHALDRIEARLADFHTADVDVWPAWQREIHAAILRVSEALGASTHHVFRPEESVFEHEVTYRVEEPPRLREGVNRLCQLGTLLGPGVEPVWPREALDRVWARFPSTGAVPLLLAYEAVAGAEEQQGYRVMPSASLERERLVVDDAGVLHLTAELVHELRARVFGTASRIGTARSWAAAIQPCVSQSWIVNVLVPGYDIRFTRPWTGCPRPTPLDERRAGRAVWAELRDRSSLNVNHGTPQQSSEIVIPGVSLRADHGLRVADLEIARTDEGYQLIDVRTRAVIKPIFYGFQSRCRSGLARFLQGLSPANREHPWMEMRRRINELLVPAAARGSTVCVFPRIVFERHLVLQRKTWTIPASALPRLQGTDAAKFLASQRWRQSLGLPDRCFVRIVDRFGQRERSARGDDCKPQYISFRSPLLVGLFERLIARVPNVLWVYEMMPELSEAPDQFVEEYIVQWEESGEHGLV